MVIFSEITEKNSVKLRYLDLAPNSQVQILQHCAAISAIAELYLRFSVDRILE